MMAVGVASPMAHGQAITRTLTAATKAWLKAWIGADATTRRRRSAAGDAKMTIGTKTPAMRSATRWIGGLPACASSTMTDDLCENGVAADPHQSRKTKGTGLVDRRRRRPRRRSVFSTGIDSPVIMLSSTIAHPLRHLAIGWQSRSPGRTWTRSPSQATSSIGTISVRLRRLRTTRAVSRLRSWISLRIASEVRPFGFGFEKAFQRG